MEPRHAQEIKATTQLREAATTGNTTSLLELLHEHSLLLHRIMVDCNAETPLHVAAMLGHTDFVKEVLSRNQELAMELDHKGCSPLHLASGKGYVEIVNMLLTIEPDRTTKFRDELGRTPLHVAAMKGRNDVVKALLHASTESIQILTHRGETVLHLAVKYNRLDTLMLLLDHNEVSQFLDCKDIDGNTILHLAVANKQTQTIKYLLKGSKGADVNIQNENGLTPLDMLLQSQSDTRDMEIAELLRSNGATRQSTPLMKVKFNNTENKEDKTGDRAINMRSGLMLSASIIATIAFQAGISPAGGLWQDTSNGHFAGRSIMASTSSKQYEQYITFNSYSFFSAIITILLLIKGFPQKNKIYMWSLMLFGYVSIVSMAATYIIGISFVQQKTSSPSSPPSAPSPPSPVPDKTPSRPSPDQQRIDPVTGGGLGLIVFIPVLLLLLIGPLIAFLCKKYKGRHSTSLGESPATEV